MSKSITLKGWTRVFIVALATVAPAGLSPLLKAQPNPQATPPASSSQATYHARTATHRHTKAAVQPPQPEAPPAPPPPNWPINDQPKPASITWNSGGLKIDAANSSLRQILDDVATTTGMKVEGLGADERVYGDYGPGSASDVLSDLLEGTGYNFLMMGQQAPGTPGEILLSARNSTASAPQAPAAASQNDNDEDSDSEIDDRVQPLTGPAAMRPGFVAPGAAGGPPRTPQQVMEEMQQRQQQIQQQMQQNPPEINNQNNPPPPQNQPN